MKKVALTPAILLLAALGGQTQTSADPRHTAGGALVLPADYREWVFLSSGLGMTYAPSAEGAANPRFDNVFVTRRAYAGFLKDGKWPDGAILLLELRASQSEGSINRGGRFQTELAGIEAEVKEGGKWTFYAFGRGQEGKPLPRTATCYSCHAQNGAVDNTFVQFYPALADVAREKGWMKGEK